MRAIIYGVVHCTAGSQNQTTDSIKAGWRARGWKSNGYHDIIDAEGEIEHVTPYENVTNGVRGFNAHSLHMSYKGGVQDGKPYDTRTDEQKQAILTNLYTWLYLYPEIIIMGHRDMASIDTNHNGIIDYYERVKGCPSFDLYEWLESKGFHFMEQVQRTIQR